MARPNNLFSSHHAGCVNLREHGHVISPDLPHADVGETSLIYLLSFIDMASRIIKYDVYNFCAFTDSVNYEPCSPAFAASNSVWTWESVWVLV